MLPRKLAVLIPCVLLSLSFFLSLSASLPARLPASPAAPGPQGQEKMSKSDPNSAIFMEDSEGDVNVKIKKAFCPPGVSQRQHARPRRAVLS